MGDDLEPAAVTELLGVMPTFAARKGELVERRGRTHPQGTGIWLLKHATEPSMEWDLDAAVVTLLASLPADAAIWQELGRRYSLDVFCGLFMSSDNQGFDLAPATLAALGARGLRLSADVYGP
jgi:hypothetical protein